MPSKNLTALQNDVDFAESSDFDPNLPLTFGGGIVIEMTLTTPSTFTKYAYLLTFSNYGKDVVRMSTGSESIYFGTSGETSSSLYGITSRDYYNGETFTVRAVILPGSTADSTKGECFLYFNGTLNNKYNYTCIVPAFVERRVNFIGQNYKYEDSIFKGTITNFTLKACNVTPSVPTPLPSPQCLLQNDVDFAESSDFDPNLPLTFGGGIVIEMTVTIPSTSTEDAIVFSFSNYDRDVVRMSISSGGYLFFGVGQGSGVSGITTAGSFDNPGTAYNGKTLRLHAGILPGSTADSTTGQCFVYINGTIRLFGTCPLPIFAERRTNFIGHDTTGKPTFQGTVADFSMRSCNGAVDTSTPSTAVPLTARPSTLAPDTAAPSAAVPLTALPDTLAPDTAAPDTVAPETAVPLTAPQSTLAPDTAAPPRTAHPVTPTAAPSTAVPASVPGATMVPATAAPILVPSSAQCPMHLRQHFRQHQLQTFLLVLLILLVPLHLTQHFRQPPQQTSLLVPLLHHHLLL